MLKHSAAMASANTRRFPRRSCSKSDSWLDCTKREIYIAKLRCKRICQPRVFCRTMLRGCFVLFVVALLNGLLLVLDFTEHFRFYAGRGEFSFGHWFEVRSVWFNHSRSNIISAAYCNQIVPTQTTVHTGRKGSTPVEGHQRSSGMASACGEEFMLAQKSFMHSGSPFEDNTASLESHDGWIAPLLHHHGFIRLPTPVVDGNVFHSQRLGQRGSYEYESHPHASHSKVCDDAYWGLSVFFAPAMNNWAHQLLRDGYDLAALSLQRKALHDIGSDGRFPQIFVSHSWGCTEHKGWTGCWSNFTAPMFEAFTSNVIRVSEESFLNGAHSRSTCLERLVMRNSRAFAHDGFQSEENAELDDVLFHLSGMLRKSLLPPQPEVSNRFSGPDEMSLLGGSYVLFVRRAQRKIINFDEVINELRSLNVPVHVLRAEELSLAQTAAVVDRARVLVGVHGAGLSNMIFLDAKRNWGSGSGIPPAAVVEVMPPFADNEPAPGATERCTDASGKVHVLKIFRNVALAMGLRYDCYDPPWDLNSGHVNISTMPPRARDSVVNASALARVVASAWTATTARS